MVAVGPKFFYTVPLPVCLWFLDRGKAGAEHRRIGKAGESIRRRAETTIGDTLGQ